MVRSAFSVGFQVGVSGLGSLCVGKHTTVCLREDRRPGDRVTGFRATGNFRLNRDSADGTCVLSAELFSGPDFENYNFETITWKMRFFKGSHG